MSCNYNFVNQVLFIEFNENYFLEFQKKKSIMLYTSGHIHSRPEYDQFYLEKKNKLFASFISIELRSFVCCYIELQRNAKYY